MEELIKKYIAIPMAIAVFRQDKEKFNEFRLGNLYEDMIDSIIDRMHQEYFKIKTELLTKHHVDVKRIEKGKYEIIKEIVELSPDELKGFTRQVMSDYLYGELEDLNGKIVLGRNNKVVIVEYLGLLIP